MADTDIIVSEMTPASQINTTDLMIMTQPDAQAETGYTTKSGTVLQVANKMLKGTEYSTDLPDFTDKTPLGGLEELKADIKALLPIGSASGNPCNFETGIADNLVSLKASILASGGGGTPSTPIPIVGISSLDITRCGINLWDEQWEVGNIDPDTGLNIGGNNVIRSTNYIPVAPNTPIYMHTNNKMAFVFGYDENKACVMLNQGKKDVMFTTNADVFYLRFRMESSYGTTYNNDISINYPSSDTTYHAYNGQTFTIDLGGTRYGGYVDAVRGKLVVTWGSADLGSLTWIYDSSVPSFYTTGLSADIKRPTSPSVKANILCGEYGTDTADAIYTSVDNIIACSTGGAISVKDSRFSSQSAFTTGVSGYILAYELATPIEIDVSAISVEAVSGVNNIISNGGGDIEVEYRDSIQHYIDSKIASVQALIL